MEWWEQPGKKMLPTSSLRSGTTKSTFLLCDTIEVMPSRLVLVRMGSFHLVCPALGAGNACGAPCWNWEMIPHSQVPCTSPNKHFLECRVSFFNLTYHLSSSFSKGSFGCKFHQGSRISLSLTHTIPEVVGTFQSGSREPVWC